MVAVRATWIVGAVLALGAIHYRTRVRNSPKLPHVAHDSNDLSRPVLFKTGYVLPWTKTCLNQLPDRVFVGKVPPRHGLVDVQHPRRSLSIPLRQITPFHDPDFETPKETRPYFLIPHL